MKSIDNLANPLYTVLEKAVQYITEGGDFLEIVISKIGRAHV